MFCNIFGVDFFAFLVTFNFLQFSPNVIEMAKKRILYFKLGEFTF